MSSALQSVEITVTAWDRRGLVRDLSDVLAAEEISIESLNTTTQRGEGTARSVLRVGVARPGAAGARGCDAGAST